jgi:uncharacterized protein DUF3846
MRAVLIGTDNSVREVTLPDDDPEHGEAFALKAVQELVGGWIECVALWPGLDFPPTVCGWVNEEGLLKRLPLNARASQLAWIGPPGVIVGPMVLIGSDGPEWADVPADTIAKLDARWWVTLGEEVKP